MTERLTLTEATPVLGNVQQEQATKGRFRVLLIKAGWGSSGYYSPELLKEYGSKIWPAGTQQYLNHPTVTEAEELPERAVQDWASEIVTDPVWDDAEGGLVAEVQVFPQWRGLLNQEFAKKVGLSIRAYGLAEHGEAEGRTGTIITELTEGISVDWVTKAGAGGKVLELIESARRGVVQEARNRNIGAWFESRIHAGFTVIADEMYGDGRLSREERIALSQGIGDGLDAFTKRVTADQPQLYQRDLWAGPDEDDATLSEARRQVLREGHGMTANELSQALSDAVREEYGGKDIFTWVRDYTDEWAVFSVEDNSADCALHQQTYTVDATTGAVTLTGDAVEVRARTTYVPAPPADDPPNPGPDDKPVTENAPGNPPADPNQIKEGRMPEITEEQARQLTEAATTRTELEETRTKLTATDARLVEATETVTAATSRITDLETRLTEADTRNLRLENDRTARTRVTEALKTSGLPEISHTKVTESVCRVLPTVDGGALDDAKLTEAITAEIDAEKSYVAALAEASGAGAPRGLGAAPEPLSEADVDAQLVEAFGEIGLDEKAAKTAAYGR